MTTENWLTLVGIIFSAIVGYFVKYALDKKAQFSSKNAEIKRQMYQEYVEMILSSIDNFKENSKLDNPERSQEIVIKLKEFHRKAVLYSSPSVINAFADMMQYSYNHVGDKFNALNYMALVTNVFKKMRKDIGLSNRSLRSGSIRLLRPLINDYDQKIKPAEFSILLNAKNDLNGSVQTTKEGLDKK